MAFLGDNKECCGCRACVEICPRKAITMQADAETFLYPRVNRDACINCGLCERVCPLHYDKFQAPVDILAFVGKSTSDEVNFNSSSGGAFTAIYEVYLKMGYIVYGVKYEGHFQVVHDCAITLAECEAFRKSKYVQSNTNGCFSKIAEQLTDGKQVLFSGVSCQIAALYSFLAVKKVSTDNLVTVNLLCHGVPSQALFDSYIAEAEQKEASDMTMYRFKNKRVSGGEINTRTAEVWFSNGHKYIRNIKNDAFLRGYYKRLFYRPSCAVCHFTRQERISDFTIADAWNIEKTRPAYKPIEGVSLILFNTVKARAVLGEIKDKMCLEPVSTTWALTSQRLFSKPTLMHESRDRFFSIWQDMGFKKAVFKCAKLTFKQNISSMLPEKIKQYMKHIKGLTKKTANKNQL